MVDSSALTYDSKATTPVGTVPTPYNSFPTDQEYLELFQQRVANPQVFPAQQAKEYSFDASRIKYQPYVNSVFSIITVASMQGKFEAIAYVHHIENSEERDDFKTFIYAFLQKLGYSVSFHGEFEMRVSWVMA
jgi:hypothetical protein